MHLKPIEDREIETIAQWLRDPESTKWLSFGPGVDVLSPPALKLMLRRDQHLLRLFAPSPNSPPAGVVALSNVDRRFQTAMLWYVLGDKALSGRGYTTRAVSKLLSMGFSELGLGAVSAWVVDGNIASLRVLEANGFKFVGRQRMCHAVGGVPHDRLLFDIIASEHKERV